MGRLIVLAVLIATAVIAVRRRAVDTASIKGRVRKMAGGLTNENPMSAHDVGDRVKASARSAADRAADAINRS